jgi:hypothetical protein
MAQITTTNREASQALNGQAVIVTLDGTDSANLSSFDKGDRCRHEQSGIYGLIHKVDYEGTSFSVNPLQPNLAFGIYGYLPVSATVTVFT